MSKRKRFLFLGSILFIAATVFTFSPMHAKTASAAASPNSCPPTQNTGSNDTWVQIIQFRLNSLHTGPTPAATFPNYPLATDGQFGPNTTTAVHDWQTSVQKIGPGEVGTKTWSSLGFCTGFFPRFDFNGDGVDGSHCPASLSDGGNNNTTWVQALQYALNLDASDGYIAEKYNNDNWYPLATDGGFGTHTKNAVESFQYFDSITPNGSVGNQTWGDLGMCY